MNQQSSFDPRREAAKQKLEELREGRRTLFKYVNPRTGDINSPKSVLLSSLASIMSFPVLFSFAFHVYHYYLHYKFRTHDLLPIVYIGIPLFIFLNPMLGFVFDRVERKQRFALQTFLLVVSAFGLFISQIFLYSRTKIMKNPVDTFNVSLGFGLFCYSLLNSTTMKNSIYLTPSQESRRKIYFREGLFQALGILFIMGLPYLYRNLSDKCACDTQCETAQSVDCETCLSACQNYTNATVFQIVTLICTIIFVVLNLVSLILVHPRNEQNLPAYYSFNKRIIDFLSNKFLCMTTLVYFLESVIIFVSTFWLGMYVFQEYNSVGQCVKDGGIALLCTGNDYAILFALLVLVFSIGALFYYRVPYMWLLSIVFSLVAGICIMFADDNPHGMLTFTMIATSFTISLLPAAKAYFSDSVYYDEYRTGYVLPEYLTFMFSLAAKIAFLIAGGVVISSTDEYFAPLAATNNTVGKSVGWTIIIATVLLAITKYSMGRFNLQAFDKIQLAIQKNHTDDFVGELTFKDPITDTAIRRPLIPRPDEDIRNMLYLDNFARNSEILLVRRERYSSLRKRTWIMIIANLIVAIVSWALVIIYREHLANPIGWLLVLPLIGIVISAYFMIYGRNVLTTVAILQEDVPRIDKDFLNKYLFFRRQFDSI